MELIQTQPEQTETRVVVPEDTAVPQISPQQEALLETLNREARKFRRMKRIQKWAIGAWLGIPAALFIIHGLLVAMGISTGKWTGSFPMSAFWIVFTAFAASKTFKDATIEAGELKDVRAVGPLADALAVEDRNVRRVAETKLIELLPQLKAGDAGLLNRAQHDQLNGVLRRSVSRLRWCAYLYSEPQRREDLAVAILKAYEQIGDAHDLPGVEWLANGEGAAARVPRLQEAAKECLPYLKERVENEQARTTLLRPASDPVDAESFLLRPAHGANSDADQLLRPA